MHGVDGRIIAGNGGVQGKIMCGNVVCTAARWVGVKLWLEEEVEELEMKEAQWELEMEMAHVFEEPKKLEEKKKHTCSKN